MLCLLVHSAIVPIRDAKRYRHGLDATIIGSFAYDRLPVSLTQMQCFRSGIMDVVCGCSLRMLCELAQHGFDEVVVCRNRHS